MDPWQQTVETRLGSLDGRIARVEDRLGGVETNLATLTERVSHLPTKSWAVGGVATLLSGFAAITAFSEKIQALLGQG